MIASITHKGQTFRVNLYQPIDISLTLSSDKNSTSAWYVNPVNIEPVVTERFIGKVSKGGSVNFNNISFNPHGNGTHTECVGHISKEFISVNERLKQFFFLSTLVSIQPETVGNGDNVITKKQLQSALNNYKGQEAIIIRTLPNTDSKKQVNYSNSNPAYIEYEAANYLTNLGIEHLLIDLPSVDRENDDGKLLFHHAFWNYPQSNQSIRTITEMIYAPGEIADGTYLLNLQIASFENDASPSKPVLFAIIN